MDCTLIVMFFNATKYVDDDRSKLEHYYDDKIAYLNVPLVIYGDEDYCNYIKELRPKEYRTQYNVMKIEDLKYWKYYNDVKVGMISITRHIINSCKLEFMKTTAIHNPFGTKYFAYMDCKLMKQMKLTDEIVIDRMSKVRNTFHIQVLGCQYNPFDTYKNIYEEVAYRYNVTGGFYAGDKEHILKVEELFHQEFMNAIELGYGNGDEMLFIKILYNNWDLFSVSYGDYQQCCRNIHELSENPYHTYHCALKEYSAKSMHKQVIQCSNMLIDKIGGIELFNTLYMRYMSAYYLGDKDTLYDSLDKIRDDPYLLGYYVNNIGQYKQNIEYSSNFGYNFHRPIRIICGVLTSNMLHEHFSYYIVCSSCELVTIPINVHVVIVKSNSIYKNKIMDVLSILE